VKYISICSGIEAASTAWHGLGWTPLAFSEIEPFPSAVLAQRYPDVPNLGDMSKYREWPEELLAECELLVGGTPCQAFSVAGLRKSLDDERGNLSLIYVHLFHHINEIRRKHGRSPAIALWENVPGVLSTKDNAFGCFISGLLVVDDTLETQDGKWPKAGFLGSETVRVGYRVLDAQYFAVAQRRRRVFLVAVPCELIASAGERACPSEILSLRESVLGNPPTRGEAWEAVAGGSAGCAASGGGCGEPYHPDRAMFNQGVNAQYDPQITADGVAASMVARGPAAVAHAASGVFPCIDANVDRKWGSNQWVNNGFAVFDKPVWRAGDQANSEHCIDHAGTLNCDKGQQGGKAGKPDEVTPPLSADADKGDQDTVIMRQSIGFNWQNGGGYGNANDGLWITEEGTGPLSRSQVPACVTGQRTHALTTRAAAVEEDGTGRGTPIIPVAFSAKDSGCDATEECSPTMRAMQHVDGNANAGGQIAVAFTKAKRAQSVNDDESWVPGEVAPTQNQFDVGDTRATTVVAFTTEQTPKFKEECALTMTRQSPSGGGQPQCVAFTQNSRDEVRQIDGDGQIVGALSAEAGMHQTNYLAFAPLQGGRSMPVTPESPTLEAGTGNKAPAVLSFKPGQSAQTRSLGESREVSCTIEGAANGNAGHKVAVASAMQVRRLTPTECCRLQGFSDDHCDIVFRKKPAADGPKYRALGNSMAVPCMAWLGYRIHLATHRDTE
jgi:DNA (cytosine-5)-methyltransferase 1